MREAIMSQVRVRFAPSPTGYLHIGSARTALFNWLYARHNKGAFIIRIEDTDRERSKPEYLDEILASLKWLFMAWDGELEFQSQRFDIYKKYAETLVEKGLAYFEGPAIIFKVEKSKKVAFEDMIRGRVEFSTDEIKDQVLMKSDGTPTYNFACVVDDHEMQITHVIRGDDHISNTPKQVILYEALGLELPKFAHIPLILSKDGGRMSKRHGATSIFEYKNMGFLPEALVNYLSLMGWAPGNDVEILPLEEVIKLFDIKDVNKTGAIFDMDKLLWMNSQYIMAKKDEEIAALIAGYITDTGSKLNAPHDLFMKVVGMYKIRLKKLSDFTEMTDFFFRDDYSVDEKASKKYLDPAESKKIVADFSARLEKLDAFSHDAIENSCRAMADESALKAGQIIHPTRVAISGKTTGAGLFEMMEVLGRKKVLERMRKAAA
jgi:glutamyl-tRNA synthetase